MIQHTRCYQYEPYLSILRIILHCSSYDFFKKFANLVQSCIKCSFFLLISYFFLSYFSCFVKFYMNTILDSSYLHCFLVQNFFHSIVYLSINFSNSNIVIFFDISLILSISSSKKSVFSTSKSINNVGGEYLSEVRGYKDTIILLSNL